MTSTTDDIENAIRKTVDAFAAKMDLRGHGLGEKGALNLEIDSVPVSLELVREPNVVLWMGADLGTLDTGAERALPWLMQQSFDAWALGGVTCGLEPKSRKVIAYVLLLEEQVTVENLTELAAYLVTCTAEIRDRIARSDFPTISGEITEPDPMATRV